MNPTFEQKQFSVSERAVGGLALVTVALIALVGLPLAQPQIPSPAEPANLSTASIPSPRSFTGALTDRLSELSSSGSATRELQPDAPAVPADNVIAVRPSGAKAPSPPALDPVFGTERDSAKAQATEPRRLVAVETESPEPSRIEDAVRIQRRLIEAGFLQGVADGVWGPRSRNALRDFRLAHGLGSDSAWNGWVQRELLASPPPARISTASRTELSVPGQAAKAAIPLPPPPPRAERNSLDRSIAMWIQARLRELALFFRRPPWCLGGQVSKCTA
jgi:Putative peptidoglycan binding domain